MCRRRVARTRQPGNSSTKLPLARAAAHGSSRKSRRNPRKDLPARASPRACSSSVGTSGICSATQIRGSGRVLPVAQGLSAISALEAEIKEWRPMLVGTYPLRRTPLFEAAAPGEAQRNPIDCNCEQACLARSWLGNRLYNSWNSSAPAVRLPSRVRVMPLLVQGIRDLVVI